METVANSVICGMFLSNNSYLMQMYKNKVGEQKLSVLSLQLLEYSIRVGHEFF